MARRRRDSVTASPAAALPLSIDGHAGTAGQTNASPPLTALQLAERDLAHAESAWMVARHGGRALMRARYGEAMASATLEQLRARVVEMQGRVLALRAELRGAA